MLLSPMNIKLHVLVPSWVLAGFSLMSSACKIASRRCQAVLVTQSTSDNTLKLLQQRWRPSELSSTQSGSEPSNQQEQSVLLVWQLQGLFIHALQGQVMLVCIDGSEGSCPVRSLNFKS